MRINTLGCDFCEGAVTTGVGTVWLLAGSNGKGKVTKGTPSLDVCPKHLRKLMQQFVRPKRSTRTGLLRKKPAWKPGRGKKIQAALNQRAEEYWGKMEGKVLRAFTRGGVWLARPEIDTRAALTKATVGTTLRRLVGRGLVQTRGGKGRYRRYALGQKGKGGKHGDGAGARLHTRDEAAHRGEGAEKRTP